jgi:hypothetical protein
MKSPPRNPLIKGFPIVVPRRAHPHFPKISFWGGGGGLGYKKGGVYKGKLKKGKEKSHSKL